MEKHRKKKKTMDNVQSNKTQRRLVSRTFKDYLLYFPALAVSGVMGLVTVAVLSKFFSPAEYGHYTLAFSTLLLLSMVTGLWLRSSVLRLLPQYSASNQTSQFAGTALAAGTAVVVIVVLLYALAMPLLRSRFDAQLYRLLWLVIPGVPILTIFTVFQESHRIQGRSALYSGLVLLRVLGGFLVGLLLAVGFGWGPAGMLVGIMLVVAAAIGSHFVWAGRRLGTLLRTLRWSGSILKDMLAFSLPIVGLNLASTVLAVSDRYLIEAYLSSHELGIYAAVYTLAEGGMRLVANTFLIATQPTIFNTWVTDGPQVAFQFIERLFRYYLILALPAFVGLSVLSSRLVLLFTTPEYAAGSRIMVFVSLALFLHGYSLIVGTVFDAAKRTMIPLVLFLVAGVLNVILNLLLLPRFGYMAAAWATCAGYGLLLILHVVAARRIVPLRVAGGYLGKIGMAAAVMGGFVVVLHAWLPPSAFGLGMIIVLAGLVYALLLLASGAVSVEERQMATAVLRKIYARFQRIPFLSNRPV